MRTHRLIGAGLLASVAACSPQQDAQAPTNNAEEPVLPAPSAPPAVTNNVAAPDAPLANKPQAAPAVDPKSAEAAGQVALSYAEDIEAHQLSKAAQLWGDPKAAAAFAQQLKSGRASIGQAGPLEGAAGSSYVTVPATFGGRGADIILRRVNDVPGSTESQRRWHIERIDWKDPA